jgi:hypothetical protein
MDIEKTIIGKDVIESLTLGMYEDSRFIYREYIQNSADQIDKAIREKLITREEGEIHININDKLKTIIIEDNATGIEKQKVSHVLKSIAQSTKERGVDKGFRGIGRLGGLGYCDTLIFETSFKGENVKSIMTWNAKELKDIINNRFEKEQASDVIDKVTALRTEIENIDSHYFKVTLNNVSSEILLDKAQIETYLSMVAPVPYDKGFILKQKIYDYIKKEGICNDEYKIFINTNQLFKLYTTTIYKDVNGKKERSGDEIFDIHLFEERNTNGEMLYWGWYGISQFEGVIDDINIGKGIRLRKGNIQIGSKHTLLKLFRDTQRGNYYFFGEIHALSSELIPNARRDYFLENTTYQVFEKRLQAIFHTELHNLYYAASKIRNANKRIQELKNIQEESANKTFIGNKEKEEFQKSFENKKQEASKAKKELDKIKSSFGTQENAVQKIFEKVVNTQKISPDNIELLSQEEKSPYRVDKLSKLPKEQRKFLSKIFEIINNVLDKKTAENLITKIEEELK